MNTNEKGLSDSSNDDQNFKWGIFYYNPADKRLMPPKRIKWLGWTVNFANPYSIALYAGIILALVGISYFFRGYHIHF